MKDMVTGVILVGVGVYTLWFTWCGWANEHSVTIAVKGFRDIALSAEYAWMGLAVNLSLSSALIIGGLSLPVIRYGSDTFSRLAVLGVVVASLLFVSFIVLYLTALFLFY